MIEIEFKNYQNKPYKHIDNRISIDTVKKYITTPEKIARHSFLPFLHYNKIFSKYVGYENVSDNERPIKEKIRSLMYAGHLDSFIYKYYSDLLNYFYNLWMIDNKLNEFSVAYRTNKKHQSSINFAAEAISFLSKMDKAFIIVGDFEKFFDTLDHRLLKVRLQRVLNTEQLSNDWYNIYKSLTKFAYIEKETLENTDHPLVLKKSNSYFNSIKDFRKYKKKNKCKLNRESYGIPQGNALSGVLANVYAMDFDKEMGRIAGQYEGFYRRYSDDFILILDIGLLQKDYGNLFVDKIQNIVHELADQNKITLQKEKNEVRLYEKRVVTDISSNQTHLDYLGFVFDGENVKLREKSIYKFYREARHLISKSKIVQKRKSLSKLPNRHKIYSLYTDFGHSKYYPSNFITYAKRSQDIFDKLSPQTNNMMLEQLKNRKKKIEKALGYRIHSRIEKK